MANFSVNQVHQLYVANKYNATVTDTTSVDGVTEGILGAFKQVDDVLGKQAMFFYKGAKGVLRSDFMQIANIGYAKAFKATDLDIKMRKVSVSLSDSVNGGDPISGQDYILGINFKNFFSSGDASQYYKDAAVHVTSEISSASAFYIAMMKALNTAFSREDGATATTNPYLSFKIYDSYSSAEQSVTDLTVNTVATKLIIEEKAQAWELGTKKARRIMFDVLPQQVYTGGDDVCWAKYESSTKAYYKEETPTTTVGNGQQIADLEWFCAGERGDQYRNVGWPNVIPTKYLTDPTQKYNVFEIHYAFTDSGVNSYRTEKEITIVSPLGEAGHKYDVINAIIGAFNSATGMSVSTLSD